jgi:hypothetical protein
MQCRVIGLHKMQGISDSLKTCCLLTKDSTPCSLLYFTQQETNGKTNYDGVNEPSFVEVSCCKTYMGYGGVQD